MKNTKTLGLLLGTTCLATIAMSQASRPGDAPAQERQQPPVAGQQNADSLKMVQQRFQQAVSTEVRSSAMKHNVKIDESSMMISLLGDGMIAGAPASGSGSSKGAGAAAGQDSQRKPGDPSSTTGTSRDQTQLGTTTSTASENVLGIVLLSRNLAPSGAAGQQGAAGRTPGSTSGQTGADGAQQDAQKRDGANAGQTPGQTTPGQTTPGQGSAAQGATGSNELVAFQVRRSQMGQNVELVDQNGQVAMQVQLLGSAHSAGRTREASAPREDREDATVGGGDPLTDPRAQDQKAKDAKAKDAQGKDRTGNSAQSDMDAANAESADWNVVYASVVNQVCSKNHGSKK